MMRASLASSLPRRLPTSGCLARPRPSSRSPLTIQQRSCLHATTAAHDAPKDIAVLGGGLTGLTTAYYLTRFHPTAKITLYEEAWRLGGWIDTEVTTVDDPNTDQKHWYQERGARTVAPQTNAPKWEDFVLYELLTELEGVDSLYGIPKTHPVIADRYIYYPDHLVALPGSLSLATLFKTIYQFLTEPIFQGVGHAIRCFFSPDQQGSQYLRTLQMADIKDMSMGDFLQARFGSRELVNNLASAMIHGIWGGDVWKLSALEGTFQNIFVRHNIPSSPQHKGKVLIKHADYFSGSDVMARTPNVGKLAELFRTAGYLGFPNGFSVLPESLTMHLKENPNVVIKKAHRVKHVEYDKTTKEALITTSGPQTFRHDKVISSLFSGDLAKLTGDALPSLKDSAAVSIQIVNLWYPDVPLKELYPGFGYLIPQSIPAENNPHCALGVIFDSNRSDILESDSLSNRGTNLTVMLGGHYWDVLDSSEWPSKEEAVAMAKDTVERHLGIPATGHVHANTKLCRNCIPQHLVGHRDRMAQAHKELMDSFEGTLAVVGGSYTMPGVLPSLQAARDVALTVSGGGYMMDPTTRSNTPTYDMKHVGKTGLGRFVDNNETLGWLASREVPFRYSSGQTLFNNPPMQQ